ncbi:hypothetical protein [Cohnella nanjingensis]|uniref:Uncharacterized protein n=1 Tax=Cohnella nanjingensis TaxID=1387779 RepID=A0A7X0RPP2_9BACL|nr:hypothetical protein [Cohnella nanjingensis]MBB6670246.1 hypothetical protein [Cohnella nanjingensis]
MGEARRRKLAGNTAPNKKWHEQKSAKRHVKQVKRRLKADAGMNPLVMAAALTSK